MRQERPSGVGSNDLQLSAELQLLLWLSHSKAQTVYVDAIRSLLAKNIDFIELQRLINYHRLWNNVALNVKKMADPAFPEQFRQWLKSQQQRCFQQTILQLHIQQQLSKVLTNAQIPHRFIKGNELALRLYGDVAWRYSRDIDLLVEYQNVVLTEQLIAPLGYTPLYASWSANDPASQVLLAMQKDNGYCAPNKPVLEVHHRISNFRDEFSKDLTTHLMMLSNGVSVLEYLYLCWHALLTNCHRTKWLVDLAVYRMRLDTEQVGWRERAMPAIKRYRLTAQIEFIDFLLAETYAMPAPKTPRFWMALLGQYYINAWQWAQEHQRANMMPILAHLLVQHSLRNLFWKFNEILRYPNPEDRQYINRYFPLFGQLLLLTLPMRKVGRYVVRKFSRTATDAH